MIKRDQSQDSSIQNLNRIQGTRDQKLLKTFYSFLNPLNSSSGNAWVGVLMLLTLVLTMGIALFSDAVITISQTKRAGQTVIAQALCDAGIEKAIWKLNETGGTFLGETFSFETGTVEVTISPIDVQNKMITAKATTGKVQRTLRARVRALPSDQDVSFHYAIQAGEGGILVSGSADIFGNLYSNAGVDFSGGGYRVQGDVYAHTTVVPNPNSKVEGNIVTGAEIVPLPEVDIETWKGLAEEGGSIYGNYSPPAGTTTLGPKKISGNFSMSNSNQVISLNGPLYVQGDFTMSGGEMRLSDIFGVSGTVIIVDGKVRISGGAKFVTNAGGGYVLVLSTSVLDDAIDYGGSATTEALALYAPNGGMILSGSGEIVATCGKRLILSGSGEIKYKSGLANANFSAGPGGSWKVIEWQIVY